MKSMFGEPTVENKRWKGLVFGAFGTRKTRFALSLPKPVVIDMEKGTTMYGDEFGFKVLHAVTADDVANAIDYLLTEDHDFATMVIDPFTIYWSALQKKWADIFFIRKKGGAGFKVDFYELQVGDWQQIKAEFKSTMRKVMMLDMNVVFTAHEKAEYSDKKGDTMVKTGEYIPDCEKSLPHFFDTVLRFTKDKDDDTIIQTKKDRSGKLPKEFRLDGDTFFKCTGISGEKSNPVKLISEKQISDIKTIEVMLISNEKYKVTPDKFAKKLNECGCKLEEMTETIAQEFIDARNEYIDKVNKQENK